MAKRKNLKINYYLLSIITIISVFFVPLLISPDLLTLKDNDLGRIVIPIFSFIRDSFYKYNSLPLWRPDQLMGEPFIGNGLAPLVYPLNVLFLLIEVDSASVIFYYLHFLIAGISTFFLARSFSLDKVSSFATAIFYTFSIKMLLHLTAGHITLIAAFSFFPIIFLSLRKILFYKDYRWVIAGAVSFSAMLILFPTVFYYSVIFSLIYVVISLFSIKKILEHSNINNLLKIFSVMGLLILGLSAIQLIPQIEYSSYSARNIIKLEDAALPLWNLRIFISSIFFPYLNLNNFDHESLLYVGFVPGILSIVGLFFLTKIKKIIMIIAAIFTVLFVAGLSTPVFPLAFKYAPLLNFSRITTRPWFIVALVAALLSGLALSKIKNKSLSFLLVFLFLAESILLFSEYQAKIPNLNFSNTKIYESISRDLELKRVYCISYCFNPQQIQSYNIQVLHGENPISDVLTLDILQKAGNYQYDKFAVIHPPYQVWKNDNPPIPRSEILGLANVKYVASTYNLPSDEFRFINMYENIYLYENLKYKPRFYFENSDESIFITKYSPNEIVLNFSPSNSERKLILSEKFYPGWFAHMNNEIFNMQKYQSMFRSISVPSNTKSVRFGYNPGSFRLGRTITFLTLLILVVYYFRLQRRSK